MIYCLCLYEVNSGLTVSECVSVFRGKHLHSEAAVSYKAGTPAVTGCPDTLPGGVHRPGVYSETHTR